MREKAHLLDHVANLTTEFGNGTFRDILAVDDNPAGGRFDQAVDHSQRGRLTTARRADEHDDRAFFDFEIQGGDSRGGRAFELLGNVVELDGDGTDRLSFRKVMPSAICGLVMRSADRSQSLGPSVGAHNRPIPGSVGAG
jgi:hypothetical protein